MILRRSGCVAWKLRGPPFPAPILAELRNRHESTHHFEGVELLFDLLRKHGREPVAGRNVSSPVIILGRPCIMELDPWAEGNVPFAAMGRAWQTPCTPVRNSRCLRKIVVIATLPFLGGCTRGIRSLRAEAWCFVGGAEDGRARVRICAVACLMLKDYFSASV